MKTRQPDFDFFSLYWRNDTGYRRYHRYHWFTHICRSDLFNIFEHRPPGPCVEVGSGRGSTLPGESGPTDVYLDILPWLLTRGSSVVADAQRLPFRNNTVAAFWGQTVCMHLSWQHVLEECFRCARDGGIIAFIEPLRDNPFVRIFRSIDPARKSNPHYLSHQGLEELGERFGTPQVKPYFLLSPLVLPLTRRHNAIVRSLQSIDAFLLGQYPYLHRYAWYATICWKT